MRVTYSIWVWVDFPVISLSQNEQVSTLFTCMTMTEPLSAFFEQLIDLESNRFSSALEGSPADGYVTETRAG